MSENVQSMIGKLVPDDFTDRDAIHVAVIPVMATVRMRPGLRVGLDENGDAEICSIKDCIGIVDPYLTEDVQPGDSFWLFLNPNTVTGMRHAWSHPLFDAPPALREHLARKAASDAS